ncbi:hypothetical protein [Pseudomonas sp. RIT-To-2]|uniref:hypothetical protein n=1 Tax=Pseudomonas sp. RIT-To-2 TaxID=3462541 RepID=UPI0024138FD6
MHQAYRVVAFPSFARSHRVFRTIAVIPCGTGRQLGKQAPRYISQETQKGTPALQSAKAQPNPMINGHQDWLNGLVEAARRARG